MSHSVTVAVAPNGARRGKADHPALPLTSAELARTAEEALAAGATMIHLHVRDAAGQHSLNAALYRNALGAIRAAVGDRIVAQVTTEAVGRYRPEEQMALVRDLRPEAVSLALRELCPTPADENTFADFLAFLRRERVSPQIILYDAADVTRLADLVGRGLVPFDPAPVLYVLGRYTQSGASGPSDLLPFLNAAGTLFPDFMICAFGPTEAACGVAAALLGGGLRVGFENNLQRPDGAIAASNADLLRAALHPLRQLGIEPELAGAWRDRMLGRP